MVMIHIDDTSVQIQTTIFRGVHSPSISLHRDSQSPPQFLPETSRTGYAIDGRLLKFRTSDMPSLSGISLTVMTALATLLVALIRGVWFYPLFLAQEWPR